VKEEEGYKKREEKRVDRQPGFLTTDLPSTYRGSCNILSSQPLLNRVQLTLLL
jgi:hypothetical protein